MDKLLKYVMLMLVTTLSMTFTACGGDDDDEPENPNSSNISKKMLIGHWISDIDQTITFNSDGTFIGRSTLHFNTGAKLVEEERGYYSLNGDELTLSFSHYEDNKFIDRYTSKWELYFDDYTNKLIFKCISADDSRIIWYGQFYKSEI